MWIAPARHYAETRHTLERLQLAEYVDLFRGEHLGFAATAQAAARWWDLAGIAKEHEAFLDRHEPALRAWEARTATPAEEAYRDYLLALDTWRRLPYTDPGLPAELLPEDWPGGVRRRCSRRCTGGCGTPGRSSRSAAPPESDAAPPEPNAALSEGTRQGPGHKSLRALLSTPLWGISRS